MKYFYAIVSLFVLSCSQMPETRYFTLDFPVVEKKSPIENTLVIKKFNSNPLYFQDKFIYRPTRFEVKFDHYKRWIQPPPQLLQLRAVEFFESTNSFQFVSTQSRNNGPQLVLICSLAEFDEVITGNKRNFKVDISYELYSFPKNKLLKSSRIGKTAPINGLDAESIVAAASSATFMVLEELQSEISNK
jgi:ABC-type uncharacterized transport system auxiliary subunit